MTADQVGVFVGFEIGQAHDHRFREKGGAEGADAFDQFFDVKLARVGIAGHPRFDLLPHFIRCGVFLQQRFGVDADGIVDDEFEPRQADAGVGEARQRERALRVADVHRDFERQFGHFFQVGGE